MDNKTKKANEVNSKEMVKNLANLIGSSLEETYGVVGLTKVKSLKNQLVILKKENYVDGVLIFKFFNKYNIDVHIVCASECKITEVIKEVKKRINYEITKKYGDIFGEIYVYVDDLLII